VVLRCSALTAIMPKSCIVCSAVASPDVLLQYCATCQSALYCSKACQRKDWKKQHKIICKLLNAGHGDMQVRTGIHISRHIDSKEQFERDERSLYQDLKQFFKLFTESTFEGSLAAARKMRKIAKRYNKHDQKFLFFHSLDFLARSSSSEMISWPNSPLLVMLQFVDPNVLSGEEHDALEEGKDSATPLQHLAGLADPFDYSTHTNQLSLAKQLIKNGANVNAVTIPHGITPLHCACYASNVTNLDFVELLLKKGADPNAQDYLGMTPLIYTSPDAPGAAKFLLNWPSIDANITTRSGASYLARVRSTIMDLSDEATGPDNPDEIKSQFLLQQWREVEEMLVERDAHDTGITAFE
jgi:hypothetical protein